MNILNAFSYSFIVSLSTVCIFTGLNGDNCCSLIIIDKKDCPQICCHNQGLGCGVREEVGTDAEHKNLGVSVRGNNLGTF